MNFEGTRFELETCPQPRCQAQVVRCIMGRGAGEALVDIAPHKDGNLLIRDTGGPRPFAETLTVAKQFGRQGQLHRRHNDTCRGVRYGRR